MTVPNTNQFVYCGTTLNYSRKMCKILYYWVLLLYSFRVGVTNIYILLHVCSAIVRILHYWAEGQVGRILFHFFS